MTKNQKSWEKKLFEMVCAYNRSLKPIGMIDSRMAKRLESFFRQELNRVLESLRMEEWETENDWNNLTANEIREKHNQAVAELNKKIDKLLDKT